MKAFMRNAAFRLPMIVLLFNFNGTERVQAQEEPASPAAETAPAADTPPETQPATAEDATAVAPPAEAASAEPASGDAVAAFDEKFKTWRDHLASLRAIQAEFKVAKKEDRPALQSKYQTLLAEARTLLPELKVAAKAAYDAAPAKATTAGDFLAQLLRNEATKTEEYEDALEIGKLLVKHQYPSNEIYLHTGKAAFVAADYDTAEKALNTAQEKGVNDEMGQQFLALLPQYRKFWVQEQTLRDAETEADDLPRAVFHTNQGDITFELFENEAPNTVANFISLIEKGFYDGTVFHRVLPGFMAQGGDPKGDGSGGPGYRIECECDQPNHRIHFRGSLSMAKQAAPDTGGSQFFITFIPTSHLNGQHTVFGRVIDGLDVLSKLRRVNPETDLASAPKDRIDKAEVVRKRPHEYVPKTLPE